MLLLVQVSRHSVSRERHFVSRSINKTTTHNFAKSPPRCITDTVQHAIPF